MSVLWEKNERNVKLHILKNRYLTVHLNQMLVHLFRLNLCLYVLVSSCALHQFSAINKLQISMPCYIFTQLVKKTGKLIYLLDIVRNIIFWIFYIFIGIEDIFIIFIYILYFIYIFIIYHKKYYILCILCITSITCIFEPLNFP